VLHKCLGMLLDFIAELVKRNTSGPVSPLLAVTVVLACSPYKPY
jgi:hypothetical protein